MWNGSLELALFHLAGRGSHCEQHVLSGCHQLVTRAIQFEQSAVVEGKYHRAGIWQYFDHFASDYEYEGSARDMGPPVEGCEKRF